MVISHHTRVCAGREGRESPWRRRAGRARSMCLPGPAVPYFSSSGGIVSIDGRIVSRIARSGLPVSPTDYEYTWWADRRATSANTVFRVAGMDGCLPVWGWGWWRRGSCGGPIKSRSETLRLLVLFFSGDRFSGCLGFLVSSISLVLEARPAGKKVEVGGEMTSSCRSRWSPGCRWGKGERSVTP